MLVMLHNGSFYFTLLLQKRLACVASVSARVRRESWEESKKGMTGEGEGKEGTTFFFIASALTFAQ